VVVVLDSSSCIVACLIVYDFLMFLMFYLDFLVCLWHSLDNFDHLPARGVKDLRSGWYAPIRSGGPQTLAGGGVALGDIFYRFRS
jgi:hypothetical protein